MARRNWFQKLVTRLWSQVGLSTRPSLRTGRRRHVFHGEILESRILLTMQTLSNPARDFGVVGASQFGPGNGVIAGTAFLGTDFATPRWGVNAFTDVPFLGRTGVGGSFQLTGTAGFDVGYYVNSGSVDVFYNDVSLSQTYLNPANPGEAFGENAIPLSFDASYAGTGSYFATSSPTLGAYADFILQAQSHGSVTASLFGNSTTASLNRQLIDIDQELLSFNRDNSNELRVLGLSLPNDPLSANWEASVPLGSFGSIILNAALDPFGLEAAANISFDVPTNKVPGLKKIASRLPSIGVGAELATMQLGIPSVAVSSASIDTNTGRLSAASPHSLDEDNLVLDIDLNVGLKDLSVNAGPLSIVVTPLNLSIGPQIYMVQTVSIVPVNKVTYTFDAPVSGSITPQGGVSRDFNNVRSLTALETDDVRLDFYGRRVNVQSSWTFQAQMTNDIDLVIDVKGDLTAGDLSVDLDLPQWIKDTLHLPFNPPPLLRQNDVVKIDIAEFDVFSKSFNVLTGTNSAASFSIGDNFEFDFNVTSLTEGSGSLRNSIVAANVAPVNEIHEIFLSAGTYELSTAGANENGGLTGDLDITSGVTRIVGKGVGVTTIDANQIDRVFEVRPGATLILEDLTITGGSSSDGGGILNSGGTLELKNVVVEGNTATSSGGGLYHNGGTTTVTESSIQNNSGKFGGGVASNAANLTLLQSTVSGNSATLGGLVGNSGSGVFVDNSGRITIQSSTISGNLGNELTAGIYLDDQARATIQSSTVAFNQNRGIELLGRAQLTIEESIVGSNNSVAVGGNDLVFTSSFVFPTTTHNPVLNDLGHNLVWSTNVTGFQGSTIRGVNPLLNPLANNGGPTRTHTLQSTSPALGTGDPNSTYDDQRALGLTITGSGRDIGAVQEFDTISVPVSRPDTLRAAILYFNTRGGSNQIVLESGTYLPSQSSGATNAEFGDLDIIGQTLTISGAGIASTLIDGAELRDRVFDVSATGSLTLENLTVTGGSVLGDGGGIRNAGGLSLLNVTVTDNFATFAGGGIQSSGVATIVDSTIEGNSTYRRGGGISAAGDLTINRSVLRGNSVFPASAVLGGPDASYGGAIDFSGANLSVDRSLISANVVVGGTGENYSSINDDYTDPGYLGSGGGLSIHGGTATISNTTISGNTATGGLGGRTTNQVGGVDHLIGGDGGHGSGGAIHVDGGNVILDSLTVIGNNAAAGLGRQIIVDGVVTDEGSAGTSGTGGVEVVGGSVSLRNSVLAGNGSDSAQNSFTAFETKEIRGTITSLGNNFISVASPAVGFSAASNDQFGVVTNFDPAVGDDIASYALDPMLGELADNGGPTFTYAPIPGSPLIDAGATTQTLDQRGRPRPIGFADDIGAVESSELFVNTFEDTLTERSLRQAIRDANSLPGDDIIQLEEGTYTLSITGSDDFAAVGDLDIRSNITLRGVGAGLTIIDATALGDRAFHVLNGANFHLEGVTIKVAAGLTSVSGLINSLGNVTIEDVHFQGAATGPLVRNATGQMMTIRRAALTDNIDIAVAAKLTAGALVNEGDLVVSAATFSGNQGRQGGAFVNHSGTATLENVTIANNSASIEGGGIAILGGTVNLLNSIVINNVAPTGADVSGAVSSQGSNIIGNSSGATGLHLSDIIDSTNPQLGVFVADAPLPYYPLLPTSDALESGSPSISFSLDQLGNPREWGNGVDIGAVELGFLNVTSAADTTTPGTLRYAILQANQRPGADTITFDAALTTPILLTSGELKITDSLTIAGNGSMNTIIDAQQNSRVFQIMSPAENVTFDGITIQNGTVSGNGGGINWDVKGGRLTISNSLITENSATSAGLFTGLGGGVYLQSGVLRVVSSTIADNSSQAAGGGIGVLSFLVGDSSEVQIINSTLSGNTSDTTGGALFFNSNVQIWNSTFTGNHATVFGGGLGMLQGTTLDMVNSIVAQNTAANADKDVYVEGGSTLAVRHSLIGNNSGSGLSEAPLGNPDLNGNLIGNPSGMGVVDPLLGPLQNNGGNIPTHALLAGSPAIDAGTMEILFDAMNQPLPVPENLLTDQRGFDRDQGQYDMGAYEYQVNQNLFTLPTVDVIETTLPDGRIQLTATYETLNETIVLAVPAGELNLMPFINGLRDRTVADGSIVEIDIEIGDFETTSDNLVITIDDGSAAIPGVAAAVGTQYEILGTGSHRVLRITTTPGSPPPSTLTLNISDGTARTDFSLNMSGASAIIQDTNVNLNVEAQIPFSLAELGLDPNGFTFEIQSSNSSVIDPANAMVTGTGNDRTLHLIATQDDDGTPVEVTLVARHSDVDYSFPFMVSVNGVHVAADNVLVPVQGGQTAHNAGTFSDLEMDTVTVQASIGQLVQNGDGTWSWSLATTMGVHELQNVIVTATDAHGAVSTTTFEVAIGLELSVSASPTSMSENGGTSTGTVSLNFVLNHDLTVNLSSSDISEATVPTTVIISAGQLSADFPISAADDATADGSKVSILTATGGTGVTSASTSIVVTDDETTGVNADILLFDRATGRWRMGVSNGSTFTWTNGPKWNPVAGWTTFTGDYNGDGLTDGIGITSQNAVFFARNNGNGTMTTVSAGSFSAQETFQHFLVGDFNGDNRDDLIVQQASSNTTPLPGSWFVKSFNGTSFATSFYGRWEASGWVDFGVGDVNQDGFDDIIGVRNAEGVVDRVNWLYGISNRIPDGSRRFYAQFAGAFNGRVETTGWHSVLVGDWDNDGRADVAARKNDGRFVYGTATGGPTPFAAIGANRLINSSGPLFSNSAFTGPFRVGDFDGDGRDDILARQSNDRNLWVAQSSAMAPTSSTAQLWGAWDDSRNWSGAAVGDFNGDGRDDYVSVDLTGSHVWGAVSNGTGFAAMSDFGLITGPETLTGPLRISKGILS
ncbi:MAG: choice-of-anchor Q domain-containing protein [Planctomycetaceae bacterium]